MTVESEEAMMKLHTAGTAVAVASLLTFNAPAAHADEVVRWNRIATEVMVAANTDPLTESRVLAILHLAVHDALNTIERRYQTYAPAIVTRTQGSAEAAVAAAAHRTLAALLPDCKTAIDAELTASLAAVQAGDFTRRGAAAGEDAAAVLLTMRAADGAAQTTPYQAGTRPGTYRPTPPDFTPALFSHWGSVHPFALKHSSLFRPAPPPEAGSAAALDDIAIVRRIGGAKDHTRNAEQTEIARFWYENSTQGWNRIARDLAAAKELDMWKTARLLALVNVAMADGFIGGFEAKYHYNYWRPATAIREAGDANWSSELGTPPVPDYPSTHTVLGAAAAAVLTRLFETDFVSFQMTSGAPYPGLTRRFWSFSEAALENGASRVLAGIHFPTAVRAGYEQGDRIGNYVFERFLLRADAPSTGPATR